MLYFYRFIINLIFILSPLIIIFRLLKKKEDIKRFKEKFCFFSRKRGNGKVIWFHGASVGEIKSVIPILEKLNRNKKINKILITSNTLSSSKIIQKLKLKKIVHQFFPIDTNFHSKIFINYWKPSLVFFIDSEIWPNILINLKRLSVPTILLNGRITKKTFLRWNKIKSFSKEIFSNFDLCLSSSLESKNFLKRLGAKNVRFVGNLKFSQPVNEKLEIKENKKKFFKSKKVWCASSTHESEELFCAKVHKELKKKYKNLLTIIIPRHVERVESIKSDLNKLNLKIQTFESKEKISKNTDIYIVDTYGKTKTFYNYCDIVFLGGSLIDHGGQNPLEATRYGCKILHGPNISNFSEIYKFLKNINISQKISNQSAMVIAINKLFLKINKTNKTQKKLNMIGQKILIKTIKEIKISTKNEF